MFDYTVQEVADRYPDHTIVIRNGRGGDVLFENGGEYANRYVMQHFLEEGYVDVYVSVHSQIEYTFDDAEEETA